MGHNQRRRCSPSRSVRAPTRNHAHTFPRRPRRPRRRRRRRRRRRLIDENPSFLFPFFSLFTLSLVTRESLLRVAVTRDLTLTNISPVVAITFFFPT